MYIHVFHLQTITMRLSLKLHFKLTFVTEYLECNKVNGLNPGVSVNVCEGCEVLRKTVDGSD